MKTFKQAFFDFGAKIQMRHLGDFQTSVQCETFFKYIQTLYFSKRGGAGKNMTSVLFLKTQEFYLEIQISVNSSVISYDSFTFYRTVFHEFTICKK